MIFVVIISGIAAAIHFSMVLICLAFTRAPGWQAYRVFALIAFLLGIYAANDALVLHHGEVSAFTDICATANGAIGLLVSALWLVFTRLRDDREFTRLDKGLLAILWPASVLACIPGVVVAGVHPPTVIASLGLRYQTPAITPLGKVFFAVSIFSILVIALRYLRNARGGTMSVKLGAFGFSLFVLMAFEELLVASGILQWPYLADLGSAGITLAFAVELSARVSDDSISLRDLNRSLEQRVIERSEDLAETREALLVAERHAALGQLASGVGHEINNPLAYVNANLVFLRDYEGGHTWDDDELEAIDEALDGVQRIRRIVGDLTVFSGGEHAALEVADVERAVASAIRIALAQHMNDAEFKTDFIRCSNVTIDESKLTQVLVNLLVNAAQAGSGKDNHTVTTRCTTEGRTQIIEVVDTGTGIDESTIDRIFDPLYTTKAVGKGTGLGLFVCRGIVDDAGGSIDVRSQPGEGTTITLKLPGTSRARTSVTVAPAPAPVERPETVEGLRIYIIDDEVRLTRAMQRMLKEAKVVVENDSRAALKHLGEAPGYDIIICDLMMPELTGMELYKALEDAGSPICSRFLFVTGGAVTSAAEAFLERNDIEFLLKPLMPIPLRKTLNAIAGASVDEPIP